MKPKKCTNCGTPIPKDVRPAWIGGKVVCGYCYNRLKKSKNKPHNGRNGSVRREWEKWLEQSLKVENETTKK